MWFFGCFSSKNQLIFARLPQRHKPPDMSIKNQRIHLIAIGGGTMSQLAIALKKNGNHVTGSDDEIFEPAYSNLKSEGLLPGNIGWNESNISSDIQLVILGMHAREDNPELVKAKSLGLEILSYPEVIYRHAENKQRIVVAGSHGKTTTTAILMHVLRYAGRKFDYLVGAPIQGFENTVKLSEEAPVMVIEGDEYLASANLPIPKFLVYKHHIGLVTGIAWDHINVFPTEHMYVRQFDRFADATPKAGILVFNDEDAIASVICHKERPDVNALDYVTPKHVVKNGITYWITSDNKEIPLKFFGKHNLSNANGARTLLHKLGISDEVFFEAIQTFEGASLRLEILGKRNNTLVFRDFAHAPSKVSASVAAVKEQYPGQKLCAIIELHTFSSLNQDFIKTYAGSLDKADEAIVYFNPDVVRHKKLDAISPQNIIDAFERSDIQVYTDSKSLFEELQRRSWSQKTLLLMSSGTFNQTDLLQLTDSILATA